MAKVDDKGRIVLPAEIRTRLGLRPGSEVTLTAEDDRVIVEPEDDPDRILDDLEALIDEAATNRQRRAATDEPEGVGVSPGGDAIAEEQRAIIRRGATGDDPSQRTDRDSDE